VLLSAAANIQKKTKPAIHSNNNKNTKNSHFYESSLFQLTYFNNFYITYRHFCYNLLILTSIITTQKALNLKTTDSIFRRNKIQEPSTAHPSRKEHKLKPQKTMDAKILQSENSILVIKRSIKT
jgi:hypothetical protein